jgi:hypothetical protein
MRYDCDKCQVSISVVVSKLTKDGSKKKKKLFDSGQTEQEKKMKKVNQD